jgi:hypothetical protein
VTEGISLSHELTWDVDWTDFIVIFSLEKPHFPSSPQAEGGSVCMSCPENFSFESLLVPIGMT